MIFIVAGLLLGLHLVGIDFGWDTLFVAFVVVLYGEVVNWRQTRLERLVKTGKVEP